MPQRAVQHLRSNILAYLALFLAVGGGGGYAIAASRSTTIHACVVRHTGELLLKKRCGRGQAGLVWNRQGPTGAVGATGATGAAGPTGPQGPAAATVAATIIPGSTAVTIVPADAAVTVTRTSAGVDQILVTASACKSAGSNTNVASVTPQAQPASGGGSPIASEQISGNNVTVYTGTLGSGGYTPQDLAFSFLDTCTT
jgi:hypothetical protein